MSGEFRRKLTVILHADVVGSTALVRRNETMAHHRIRDAFRRLSESIEIYGGTAHEIRGDALLAEFARASDAVCASLAFQSDNKHWNEALSDDIQPMIRIGISLGEVVIADGTLTGVGVVLAQRLEQLAEPGGVVVQGTISETVPSRLPLAFESLGEHRLKGFDQPVRAFTAAMKPGDRLPSPELDAAPLTQEDGRRVASVKPSGEPSAKASIAVLPFTNMSADPDQEHFCDGITEDIITALSRNRWYDVTSRSSSFAYKGQSPDVRQVARDLGVGYVLEGSMRKGGERVRITAQLIDARSGNHVWAEHYNCEHADEFAVQDEIAHRVASNLSERIWQDIAMNIGQKQPETYGPYEYTFRGIELVHRLDPDEIARAKIYLTKALALDPDLPAAHLGLGFCYLMDFAFWDDPSGQALDKAHEHAVKLETLAPEDAQTFRLLSRIHAGRHRFDEARRCVDRALRINPDDGDIIANKGVFLMFYGHSDEAIEWFDQVLALHSDTPHTVDIMLLWSSLARFALTEYGEAIATLKGINGLAYMKSLLLGACYAQVGSDEDAKRMSESVLRTRPNLRASDLGLWQCFRTDGDQQHLRSALIRAGLPGEEP